MTIRAQNAKVRLMRGSEIVIMESVQREDGRCESFTEHDEPVMELHTEWKHQAMPGSPVTETRVSRACVEFRWYRGFDRPETVRFGAIFCAPAILVAFVQKEGVGENQEAALGRH